MSYKTLSETGTMAQSFHFNVTPEKKLCSSVAQASNGVCDAGGAGKSSQPGDQCQQWSEFNCPNLSKFCCPKGTVGRPKRYSNGYSFEYTTIGSKMKPYPQCPQDCSGKPSCPKANGTLAEGHLIASNYEWNDEIYAPTESMRPPVF